MINDYMLYVYKVKTKDIFHTIGEIMYRTIEEIKRIDFAEYTENRVNFWKDDGYEITEWRDKYTEHQINYPFTQHQESGILKNYL